MPRGKVVQLFSVVAAIPGGAWIYPQIPHSLLELCIAPKTTWSSAFIPYLGKTAPEISGKQGTE